LFGHLFDHCPWNLNQLFYNYTFIVGPLNNYDPKVNDFIVSLVVKLPLYKTQYVTTIIATDRDGDGIRYSFVEPSDYFNIDSDSGVIRAIHDITVLIGEQSIHVGVEDDGIPPRKSISVLKLIFEAADSKTVSPDYTDHTTEMTNTVTSTTDTYDHAANTTVVNPFTTVDDKFTKTSGITTSTPSIVTSGATLPSKNSGLLSLLLTLKMLWKAVFNDVDANETRGLYQSILLILRDAFKGMSNILKVTLDGLSPGSVVVKLGVLLSEKATNKTANETLNVLRKYLETVNYTVLTDKENITIKEDSLIVNVDPCQNVNCGENGECVYRDQHTACSLCDSWCHKYHRDRRCMLLCHAEGEEGQIVY
ncbi:unnamed protein product, partial [Owenia fusiformis]